MLSDTHFLDSTPSKSDTPHGIGRDLFADLTNRLRDEPCVSFALICEGWFDFSPEFDIAVRLLSIAARDRPVDHGRLIWGLQENLITPASMESGKQAVRECISRLNHSGVSFEFLAHVEGQLEIAVHFSPDEGSCSLRQLADALADEIGGLLR